jgi:cellulose synthase/poly-beta-1,6-N-acetylglucosamine synthase-like glycosyltransferase
VDPISTIPITFFAVVGVQIFFAVVGAQIFFAVVGAQIFFGVVGAQESFTKVDLISTIPPSVSLLLIS